jgi:PASTA domain
MAKYNLSVPYCYIREIRSPRNDTLVAAVGLRVMNAQGGLHMDYSPQSKNLGDHRHHTTAAIDISYSDVDVPDPTPELPDGGAIYWTLVLTNSAAPGAATDAEKIVVGLLQALADKQINPATNLSTLLLNIGLIGLGNVLGLLTPGRCDGIVGALNLNFTARQLAQTSTDPVKVNWPGTDSPIGCGSNSNYDLYYVVAPPPPPPVIVTVPDLLNQSPDRARQLAEEAGLSLSTTEEKILPKGSAPRVESQNPAPGSQVEQGTSVHVVIALPVEGRQLPP